MFHPTAASTTGLTIFEPGSRYFLVTHSMKRRTFSITLDSLRRDSSTAGDVVDAVAELKNKRYAPQIAEYLSANFGREPKVTRALIRAAGKSSSRELHDILVKRLMDRQGGQYTFELIEAISESNAPDYAAAIVPFLKGAYGESIQSTAAYALGLLRSPVAILPLLALYQRARGTKLGRIAIESLRKIVQHPSEPFVLDVYLLQTPERFRREIRQALSAA